MHTRRWFCGLVCLFLAAGLGGCELFGKGSAFGDGRLTTPNGTVLEGSWGTDYEVQYKEDGQNSTSTTAPSSTNNVANFDGKCSINYVEYNEGGKTLWRKTANCTGQGDDKAGGEPGPVVSASHPTCAVVEFTLSLSAPGTSLTAWTKVIVCEGVVGVDNPGPKNAPVAPEPPTSDTTSDTPDSQDTTSTTPPSNEPPCDCTAPDHDPSSCPNKG